MNKFFFLPIIISMLAISGCARHAQIIIDPKGVDMEAYHADLAECQHLEQIKLSQNLPKALYVSFKRYNPEIPIWVDKAVEKAVHINPENRFSILSEFTCPEQT